MSTLLAIARQCRTDFKEMYVRERNDIDEAWNTTLRLNNIEKGQCFTIDSIMKILPMFSTGARLNPVAISILENYVNHIKSNNSTSLKVKLRSILAYFANTFVTKVEVYDYSIEDVKTFLPNVLNKTLHFSIEHGSKVYKLYVKDKK